MRPRHACPMVAFAVALALAGDAAAQGSGGGIAAQLFDSGRDLMKSGDYAAACPKLAESARLEARVGTIARLAECEEKLGQLATARGHWQDAINLARTQKDDRLAHVEDELRRVDAIVPKLVIKLSGAAPAGLALRIDAIELGVASVEVPLRVDPGRHVVAASATGKKPWSTAIETKADGAVTNIAVPAFEDDAPLPPASPIASPSPTAPAPDAAGQSRGPLATAGLVTAAVGVVGVGVSVVFGVVAKSKNDKSQQDGCLSGLCPEGTAADEHDAARNAGTLSTLFFVAGGVLVAGGVAMWFFAPRAAAKHDASSVKVIAAPRASGATVGLEGRWW